MPSEFLIADIKILKVSYIAYIYVYSRSTSQDLDMSINSMYAYKHQYESEQYTNIYINMHVLYFYQSLLHSRVKSVVEYLIK